MQRIQKTIAEFLSGRPLPAVGPDDTVAAAIEVMRERDTHAVIVVDGEALAGIFTGRDFLNRVAAQRRNPAATPMRDVMTAEPECLRDHDSIAYAINRMAVRGFRNIPIVDDARRATAVLNIATVTSHLSEVFAEVIEADAADTDTEDEWTDIGGG